MLISEGSAIMFSEASDAISVIRVLCRDLFQDFRFTAKDTVQELNFALQWHRGKESPPFSLENATGLLGDGDRLSVFGSIPIQLVDLFQFRSEDESVSLPMREDGTLMDAAAALAEHFKIPQKWIQFLMGDSVIDDLSRQIRSFGNSIDFSRRRRLQTFVFNGQHLDLLVNFFHQSAANSIFLNQSQSFTAMRRLISK
jgi:hypothetical protein